MRILNRCVVSLLVLGALSGCARQPEKPLELRLTLAKRHIKTSEYVWYLLEMKNVGRKPVRVADAFWCLQNAIASHALQTHLEIIGPDGQKVWPRRPLWGWHGERRFWTNECGDDGFCSCKDGQFAPRRDLKGGETLTAAPSEVAPIRKRNRYVMDDPGDPRDLPEIPQGWPKEKVDELRKKWKQTVENTGYLMGEPGFKPDSKAPAVSHPRGYRVLDVYDFYMPGKYRMRFVYTPFGYSSAADFEDSLKQADSSLGAYLTLTGWPKETRVFEFASNWVEFEAERAPFPEHLFTHRVGETAQQRARTEKLRRSMQEVLNGVNPDRQKSIPPAKDGKK